MERTHTITLAADAATEWAKVSQDIAARALIMNRADDERLREAAETQHAELTARLEELEADIATASRVITTTRLSPKRYSRLVVEHPPRPGDAYDERMGFNTDTFDAALMAACITGVTDAHGNPVDDFDWTTAAEQMSFTDYQAIITDVMGMHTARDAVPFSLADWAATHS